MADLSIKRFPKVILWIAALFIFFYTAYLLSDIIIILAISILLAFIFDPLVTMLEQEGFNRLASTLFIFIGFGLFVYLGLSVFIPQFSVQMAQLIETMRTFSLHDQVVEIEKEIRLLFPFFPVGELSTRVEEFLSNQIINSFDSISILLSSIFSVIAILVIVPFISFFLLKDSRHILQGILHIMPNKYFEMSYYVSKKVSVQIGRFVRAWIFDATFVGTMCGLGFYIIGIDNALPLGVIEGLGHLVPYLGPIIGGIPAVIISIIQFGDLSHIPHILVVLAVIYTLDNGFVQPYVFAKSVDLHPIMIILLIIAGSQLFGVLGMLLAVPTAAVIRTLLKETYFAFKNYKIAKI
ncbi:MAG TPA: AI-2E family transporter [Ignavibacteriaceae bacterium]|nr:AI-2E family transporter [Ignavibacteriaceae bacterium]